MHRTACFGRCPIYTIELKGGGQAHYHGDNFTLVHGDHDFSLPTEAIQCLVADFRTIDFWSLADRYAAQVTDLQATVLTLEIGGHKKSLIDYGGDMVGMPASVTDMENAIDAAASGPWALGDATTVASLKAEHLDFRSAQAADILARAAELDKPEVALDLLAAGARPIGHGVSMDGPLGLNPIESAARNGRAPLVRALIAAGVFEQGEAGLKERALLAAVANGDSEIVAEILKQNPNVDGRTDDGTTALMEVDPESNDPPVTGGAEHQVSIARQLLAAGADARLLNEAGKSALFDLDNPDIVRLMVKAGAVLEQRNSAGETPLISAQSDAAAMALIEAGADVTIHDDKGEGLWAQATENKWPRVLAYLAAHGTVHGSPKPRPVSWPPRLKALIRRRFDFHSREAVLMLGRAASEGRDRLALGLLAAGVPANQVSGGASYDTTAIKIASAAGDIGLVRALIAAGALRGAPYHAGENALIAAVAAPYPDVVSVLCAAGVDVNAHDSLGATALTSVGGDEKQRAASLQTIRILLAAKADPRLANGRGETALHRAQSPEIVNLLLSAGADLEARDNSGETPLIAAGDEDVAQSLLAAGAKVNAKDEFAETALHKAQTADMARLLFKAGADIEARDDTGRTPLLRAANVRVAAVLLEAGAKANAKDDDGYTALHKADSAEMVRLLLKGGADIEARNLDGQTPLLAMRDDDSALVLIKAGARIDVTDSAGETVIRQARTFKLWKTLAYLRRHVSAAHKH